MTREEAIGLLEWINSDYYDNRNDEAVSMAITALRGPIPNPETGLVPCGCGGEAVLRNVNIVETGNHCVSCGQCGVRTEWLSKDKAIKVWNAARGYREES